VPSFGGGVLDPFDFRPLPRVRHLPTFLRQRIEREQLGLAGSAPEDGIGLVFCALALTSRSQLDERNSLINPMLICVLEPNL
jgi:hypothetical protein